MYLYLPIAETSLPLEVLLSLGALVGMLSGLFGVGGGFLTTPLLVALGIPPSVAVSTQTCQIVASSTASVIGHWQKGNVDFQMGRVMLMGSGVGAVIGIFLFKLLRHIGQIDLIIAVLYTVLLGTIGVLMLIETGSYFIRTRLNRPQPAPEDSRLKKWFASLPNSRTFPASNLTISIYGPLAIGFVGGILVSLLGVGAGFILLPAMIYILGMPPLLVAGTSLFQILCTSVFTAVMHATLNHTVDLMLAAPLIVGSVFGAMLGLRASKYIRGTLARFVLGLLILAVGLSMASGLLIAPANPYSVSP